MVQKLSDRKCSVFTAYISDFDSDTQFGFGLRETEEPAQKVQNYENYDLITRTDTAECSCRKLIVCRTQDPTDPFEIQTSNQFEVPRYSS